MSSAALAENLSALSRLRVDLVVNDNRTTMISILDRKRSYIKISVHRMFLNASQKILDAMVDFIHNHKKRTSSALLQDYINTHLPTFGYEKKLDTSKLVTMGDFHDLKLIYHKLNKTYFNNELDLNITWFGEPRKRRGSNMTYGLYQEPLKLIKVHRLLDRKMVPEYYVEFVIYHEMLHEVHKPALGNKCTHIHTPAFRAQEKLFKHYNEAVAWEKKSYRHFFR